MHRLQQKSVPFAQGREHVQQNCGIEPAGQSQGEPCPRRNVAGQNLRHGLDHTLTWQEFP